MLSRRPRTATASTDRETRTVMPLRRPRIVRLQARNGQSRLARGSVSGTLSRAGGVDGPSSAVVLGNADAGKPPYAGTGSAGALAVRVRIAHTGSSWAGGAIAPRSRPSQQVRAPVPRSGRDLHRDQSAVNAALVGVPGLDLPLPAIVATRAVIPALRVGGGSASSAKRQARRGIRGWVRPTRVIVTQASSSARISRSRAMARTSSG